jgi:tRNA(fMet)-specific endonuclease VapC
VSDLFMLDTDIVSYAIKGEFPSVEAHLRRLDVMQVCISAVTRAELRFGVRRLSSATRLAAEVEDFLSTVHTLPWDEIAADEFAEVRAELDRVTSVLRGHLIRAVDNHRIERYLTAHQL